jgi:hypothetical protein
MEGNQKKQNQMLRHRELGTTTAHTALGGGIVPGWGWYGALNGWLRRSDHLLKSVPLKAQMKVVKWVVCRFRFRSRRIQFYLLNIRCAVKSGSSSACHFHYQLNSDPPQTPLCGPFHSEPLNFTHRLRGPLPRDYGRIHHPMDGLGRWVLHTLVEGLSRVSGDGTALLGRPLFVVLAMPR